MKPYLLLLLLLSCTNPSSKGSKPENEDEDATLKVYYCNDSLIWKESAILVQAYPEHQIVIFWDDEKSSFELDLESYGRGGIEEILEADSVQISYTNDSTGTHGFDFGLDENTAHDFLLNLNRIVKKKEVFTDLDSLTFFKLILSSYDEQYKSGKLTVSYTYLGKSRTILFEGDMEFIQGTKLPEVITGGEMSDYSN